QPFVTNFLHPIALRFGASRVARAFLVCVLPPVPRCSDWASSSLISPSCISLPRSCSRVGLHIDLFGACSAFTRVAARTLAPSPICDQLHRRLQPFRHLHDCSGCFRLERLPGGALTHWKAPPSHGARKKRSFPRGAANRSNRLQARVPGRPRVRKACRQVRLGTEWRGYCARNVVRRSAICSQQALASATPWRTK